jgi:CRISPR-associated protein Cmr6
MTKDKTMPNIPNIIDKIPMMYRAQTKGRSQLQYISSNDEQDSERWVNEWIDRVYPHPPEFGENVQTQIYTLAWRFVTNGGQDDGIIRPIIGAYGIPFYSGSSMKGAFCQACTPQQIQRYQLTKNGDEPSLLRFHGGYPVNDWTDNLLDIVHPQQEWQVKTLDTTEKPDGESGFAMISLYRPTFKFGISSLIPNPDWTEIWSIWERALGYGIGCRVSSGYGLSETVNPSAKILYKCSLKGQGQASQTINNDEGEFRPNIFRGALRGHALRIFGGLTDADTAKDLVDTLFGGIEGKGKQGLLGMSFQSSSLSLGEFTDGYGEPTYNVTGDLRWFLTQKLAEEQQETLKPFVASLMRFAMLLGGFGKSWRRADHRLFYEDYYKNKKPLIGCHWQWHDKSLINDTLVRNLNHVAPFLDAVQTTAKSWMQCQGIKSNPNSHADWREIWHPDNVQVWGRLAENQDDCKAIAWLHKPYQKSDRYLQQPQLSIKQSPVTGSISQVGKLWHRMYPVVNVVRTADGGKKARPTHQYLELLTIYQDDSPEYKSFSEFLHKKSTSEGSFQLLWGTSPLS